MRYRVVRCGFIISGYVAEFRYRWWPFWLECSRDSSGWGSNWNGSIRAAQDLCERHAERRRTRMGKALWMADL